MHLPRESEIAVTGDAWILQPTQPSRDSQMINELLSPVTRGFDRPDSPLGTEKLLSRVTRGFDSADSPIGSQKLLSRVTGGFDSPASPLGVRNCCHG